MDDITIQVQSEKIPEHYLLYAAEWCLSKLIHDIDTITIHIDIISLKNGIHGYCYIEDGIYKIELGKRLKIKSAIRYLFHEMVHVKQFYTNQLEIKQGKTCELWYWLGKISKKQYKNQPWEREASILEEILYDEFNIHLDEKELTWLK